MPLEDSTGSIPVTEGAGPRLRFRLRSMLFFLLVGLGVLPLATSSWFLVRQNRELLVTEEKRSLTQSAHSLSRELNDYLGGTRRLLQQLGSTMLAVPGPEAPGERLREPWIGQHLQRFMVGNRSLVALRVLTPDGAGPRLAPQNLPLELSAALDDAFAEALASDRPTWRFAVERSANEPMAALAVPVRDEQNALVLVVEAVARLRLVEAVFEREATDRLSAFLIAGGGQLLWSEGADETTRRALVDSDVARDFARKPLVMAVEYEVATDEGTVAMLGHVSPVDETGWGVVVQKPASSAFEAARRMVWSAAIATLMLFAAAVVLALGISRGIGGVIRRLTRTTHAIAEGSFGRRIPDDQRITEFAELAQDFNRMSGHVEEHVERLREAARQNEELFISSIRAFSAAIDAKDPYTRGHSERVAELSRTIARHLGQSDGFLEMVWIGALLHDVGKIGVDDRILSKGGVLTAAEFEAMKAHPVIGADIIAPIEQLKEMIPIVRWHHENWNGRGYPDGIKGAEIPLSARIVAVADCYDAVTTDRPYQTAYEPRYAAEVITKLAGSRFDAKVVTAFLRAFELGDLVHQVREEDDADGVELPATAEV